MATNLRRFTISVTPEMEVDLDKVKKDYFYNVNQNEMIRSLINRGLTSIEKNEKNKNDEES